MTQAEKLESELIALENNRRALARELDEMKRQRDVAREERERVVVALDNLRAKQMRLETVMWDVAAFLAGCEYLPAAQKEFRDKLVARVHEVVRGVEG